MKDHHLMKIIRSDEHAERNAKVADEIFACLDEMGCDKETAFNALLVALDSMVQALADGNPEDLAQFIRIITARLENNQESLIEKQLVLN